MESVSSRLQVLLLLPNPSTAQPLPSLRVSPPLINLLYPKCKVYKLNRKTPLIYHRAYRQANRKMAIQPEMSSIFEAKKRDSGLLTSLIISDAPAAAAVRSLASESFEGSFEAGKFRFFEPKTPGFQGKISVRFHQISLNPHRYLPRPKRRYTEMEPRVFDAVAPDFASSEGENATFSPEKQAAFPLAKPQASPLPRPDKENKLGPYPKPRPRASIFFGQKPQRSEEKSPLLASALPLNSFRRKSKVERSTVPRSGSIGPPPAQKSQVSNHLRPKNEPPKPFKSARPRPRF